MVSSVKRFGDLVARRYAPTGRNQVVRDFVETVMDIPLQQVLSVDESSFDSRMILYYGYCYKGKELKPLKFTTKSLSRDRLSLICGVGCDGVKGTRVVTGWRHSRPVLRTEVRIPTSLSFFLKKLYRNVFPKAMF
jgi:hypothetical protein